MRILLDENLPADLVDVLRALGHDVEHVYSKTSPAILIPTCELSRNRRAGCSSRRTFGSPTRGSSCPASTPASCSYG